MTDFNDVLKAIQDRRDEQDTLRRSLRQQVQDVSAQIERIIEEQGGMCDVGEVEFPGGLAAEQMLDITFPDKYKEYSTAHRLGVYRVVNQSPDTFQVGMNGHLGGTVNNPADGASEFFKLLMGFRK